MLRRTLTIALALNLALMPALSTTAAAFSRIKDVADIEGVRENMLVGYGLVVGLNGTGDSLRNAPFTQQSLQAMLERLGVNTRGANVSTGNVAAVMVTASLPAFATQGSHIDVTVSAMGDAKSLQGGTLLVTPLQAADSNIYAVAQGQIAISGFTAQGQAATVTRGVPTSGRISSGAIVEREVHFDLASLTSLRLALRNPDLTTAKRVAIAPELPTIAESGVPGFDVTDGQCLFMPGKTPQEYIRRVHDDVIAALAYEPVKQKFVDINVLIETSAPQGVTTYLKAQMAKWGGIIKDADIKLD